MRASASEELAASVQEITRRVAQSPQMEQQGSAVREIAEDVRQAASGTPQISSNIDGVSQAASDTGVRADNHPERRPGDGAPIPFSAATICAAKSRQPGRKRLRSIGK